MRVAEPGRALWSSSWEGEVEVAGRYLRAPAPERASQWCETGNLPAFWAYLSERLTG